MGPFGEIAEAAAHLAPAPAVARLYWGADTAGKVPLPGPRLHSTCACRQPAPLATRLRPGAAALLRRGAPLQLPCSPLSAGPSIPPRCAAADSEPGCPSARTLCVQEAPSRWIPAPGQPGATLHGADRHLEAPPRGAVLRPGGWPRHSCSQATRVGK